MAEENVDYSQIVNFLYRMEKRITYLEKDLLYLERHITSLENKRVNEFSKLTSEMKSLRDTLASLKSGFNQCIHYMTILGKDLKNSVKSEELAGLNNAVDEIKFDEYVTRRDIERKII